MTTETAVTVADHRATAGEGLKRENLPELLRQNFILVHTNGDDRLEYFLLGTIYQRLQQQIKDDTEPERIEKAEKALWSTLLGVIDLLEDKPGPEVTYGKLANLVMASAAATRALILPHSHP